jgi:hypothetical protein
LIPRAFVEFCVNNSACRTREGSAGEFLQQNLTD